MRDQDLADFARCRTDSGEHTGNGLNYRLALFPILRPFLAMEWGAHDRVTWLLPPAEAEQLHRACRAEALRQWQARPYRDFVKEAIDAER